MYWTGSVCLAHVCCLLLTILQPACVQVTIQHTVDRDITEDISHYLEEARSELPRDVMQVGDRGHYWMHAWVRHHPLYVAAAAVVLALIDCPASNR